MPLGEQACAAPWARDSDSEPNTPQLVLARMRRLGLGLGASESHLSGARATVALRSPGASESELPAEVAWRSADLAWPRRGTLPWQAR